MVNMLAFELIIIDCIKVSLKNDLKVGRMLDQIVTRVGFDVLDVNLYF